MDKLIGGLDQDLSKFNQALGPQALFEGEGSDADAVELIDEATFLSFVAEDGFVVFEKVEGFDLDREVFGEGLMVLKDPLKDVPKKLFEACILVEIKSELFQGDGEGEQGFSSGIDLGSRFIAVFGAGARIDRRQGIKGSFPKIFGGQRSAFVSGRRVESVGRQGRRGLERR